MHFILILFILFIIINIIISNYEICIRNYPYENLMKERSEKCKYNPFSYTLEWKEWHNINDLDLLLIYVKNNGNVLFYTVIDDHSFRYILNLYTTFLVPFEIKSLLVIVFYKSTLIKCKKNNIICVYKEWPLYIRHAKNISLRKKLWFLKYYYFFYIIKERINLLYIDSDVFILNNCLHSLINRNEDVVLLKSQLPQEITYGNSGIV